MVLLLAVVQNFLSLGIFILLINLLLSTDSLSLYLYYTYMSAYIGMIRDKKKIERKND